MTWHPDPQRMIRHRPLCAAALLVLSLCGPARAAGGAEPDAANGVAPAKPATLPTATATVPATAGAAPNAHASDVQRYCQNIAAAAAEARSAWQTKKLGELQGQLAKTIADLDARQADLKAVLARRDDALKRADATLVGIFGKMKPDAAAAQLSALDDTTAAAVLQQLNPRAASAILNEIAPERAVHLVNAIAGRPPADGSKS